MKKHILLTTIALIAFTLQTQAIEVKKFPFEITFGTPAERTGWTFLNSDNAGTNTWVIGADPDYAYGDSCMLYLSNDGGTTRKYNDAGILYYNDYRCMAYCALDSLPAGEYILNFRYRGLSPNSDAFIFPRIVSDPNLYHWYESEYIDGRWTEYRYYTPIDNNSSSGIGRWWQEASYPFTISETSTQYLCFFFRYNYYNSNSVHWKDYLGYAVDAIQIYPAEEMDPCVKRPQALQYNRYGNNAVFSWAGNASEYQVEYFMSDTAAHIYYAADNVTGLSYTIHSEDIPEGSYTFRVRSICGLDTSAWAAIDYQLVYDISQHCMDYLDFDDPDVKPQRGDFSCPWCWGDVKEDYGFLDERSRHTVHHYPRDYDERTNYKLRTFPQGQPAAVRLGNWRTGAEAEDIVYTLHVNKDMGILQLRYALVMQLPGHLDYQQPRFTLEFLDSVGVLIDSCGYVDFTASPDLEGSGDGWHREHVDGEADVIWKDWTLVGLNMRNYIGRTIQVRITAKDCSEGAHYGYAYFTLACSPGTMEGIHCGMKPDHFTVDEGFFYRWYRKWDDPQVILSRDRTYQLTNSIDTATYCVDMINMIDTNCYFTLEASSLAYIPHSAGGARYAPANCQNYVQMVDSSTTQGVYWTPTGQKVVVKNINGAEEYLWDFGPYGTSTEKEPRIAVADAGDTLHVVLHTFMENKLCEDTLSFDIAIPPLEIKRTVDNHYFCRGGSVSYKGKEYTEEGDFVDTLKSWTGCDSLSIIALRFFLADTIHYYDTLCVSDGAIQWQGQTISTTGDYFASIKSTIYDCDSIYNILHLYAHPLLDMAVNYSEQSLCMGNGEIEVPFATVAGTPTGYDLLFSPEAKAQGFVDRYDQVIESDKDTLLITMNDNVWAGQYSADLVFHNRNCDSRSFPIVFQVYYDPGSLINQRWNDFLSVRKTAYDQYGGFYDYQWYKDGEPIVGQTGSQLYLPQEGLQEGSAYAVEFTRTIDGVRMRSCDYYPTIEPTSVTLTVFPTVLESSQRTPVHIRLDESGQASLYHRSGLMIGRWDIVEGENQINFPMEKGIYLLRILTESGKSITQKLIVE